LADVKATISRLVDLQKVDHRVIELKKRKDDLDGGLVVSKKSVETARTALEAAHKAAQEAKAHVHRKEMDVSEREEQIRQLNGKLGSATSNKEYQGILLKIGELKAENGRTETDILMAMDEVEAKDKLHEDAKAKMRDAEAGLRDAEAKIAAQKAQMESDAAASVAERAAIAAEIPPEALRVYERIRAGNKKSGTAVAAVHGEYCQGCQMAITANELSELIRGEKLTICRTCQRILVLET
jgi:predicted  nucleic acid-binding Zn-ribbon protein